MNLYDIEVKTIDGTVKTLAEYRNHVLLIVNVASRCGFTSQYAGLEELYRKYRDQGLVVLGFPCNQFGDQEPGTEAEIQQFCSTQYNVTFPMFAKVDVNGPATHPLYQFLKSSKKGLFGTSAVKWNFSKFIVNRQGEVCGRYGSASGPSQLERDLLPLLENPK